MKVLDVGCGVNKVEGAVGLDISPRSHADVIHDLGVAPYPFPDNEFDLVVSNHVVEHVPDVMAFIAELHGFRSRGRVFVGMVLTALGTGVILGTLLILILGPEAFADV